ncbi:MAG: hypothetical protein KatS3mg033_2362 [Thermonema sp.]|uniref:hypothetical protein n=1 Tax=Thermonema sp. TaxID=2231181 RepID=UPI0021DDD7C8|nr:hypothetical protein [Thermonema sp.]GIV40562.1 MAG: hypothetical protein KatS3mg033_2362 [Thermonema sp.]
MRKIIGSLFVLLLLCGCSSEQRAAEAWADWQCRYTHTLRLFATAPPPQSDSLWQVLRQLEEERLTHAIDLKNSLGNEALNPDAFRKLDSLAAALAEPCVE